MRIGAAVRLLLPAAVVACATGTWAAVPAGLLAPPRQAAAARPAPTVWDGVYTSAQRQRGEPIYVRECSTCHGETLKGGEGSPPLTGVEFTQKWTGRSIADLFDVIQLTMPPPPDTPGRLKPQQNLDVVAYILSVNGIPAGTAAELTAVRESLKRIRITFARER